MGCLTQLLTQHDSGASSNDTSFTRSKLFFEVLWSDINSTEAAMVVIAETLFYFCMRLQKATPIRTRFAQIVICEYEAPSMRRGHLSS